MTLQVMQMRICEIIRTDTYKDVKDRYTKIRNKIKKYIDIYMNKW